MKIAIRQSQKINSRIHNSRIAIRQRIAQLGSYQKLAKNLSRSRYFVRDNIDLFLLFARWLLIFDSEGISEHWLKTLHGKNEVITISYYSAALKNTLESALSDGNLGLIY